MNMESKKNIDLVPERCVVCNRIIDDDSIPVLHDPTIRYIKLHEGGEPCKLCTSCGNLLFIVYNMIKYWAQ